MSNQDQSADPETLQSRVDHLERRIHKMANEAATGTLLRSAIELMARMHASRDLQNPEPHIAATLILLVDSSGIAIPDLHRKKLEEMAAG